MLKYRVVRKNDTVDMVLMIHKIDKMWSFVNVTECHICPCKFATIEDAMKDMDKQVLEGKIIEYIEII